MKLRLNFRELASFLLPALLPLVMLSVFVSVFSFLFVRQEVDLNNSAALNQTQIYLESIISTANRIGVDVTSSNSMLLAMKSVLRDETISYGNYSNFKNIQNFLSSHISAYPSVTSVYLYIHNIYGHFFSSNGSMYSLASFYDTAWYDVYLENQNLIGGYYELRTTQSSFERSSSDTYLTLYYNIFYPGRAVSEGVVAVNLRVQYLSDLLDRLAGGTESVLIITQEDGNIICAGNSFPSILGLDGSTTQVSIPQLSRQNMITSLASPTFSWTYSMVTPNAYAYRMPKAIVRITLFVCLVALFLALLLAMISSNRQQKAIAHIIEILEQSDIDNPQYQTPGARQNSYDSIVQNILKIYVKQNHLNLQLSKKRHQLEVMELLALQSQINPHFLNNSLQTIYLKALGLTGKPNEVNEMLEHLMVILRYSSSMPINTVPLAEEIQCTKSYVLLEQYQYGPRLVARWHIAETLDLEAIKIPKLTIQPLVENCVRHGLYGEENPLTIDIFIDYRQDRLRIQIHDNGAGIPAHVCSELSVKLQQVLANDSPEIESVHIGLLNTAKRLHLNYPGHCDMTITSQTGQGTQVTITIQY